MWRWGRGHGPYLSSDLPDLLSQHPPGLYGAPNTPAHRHPLCPHRNLAEFTLLHGHLPWLLLLSCKPCSKTGLRFYFFVPVIVQGTVATQCVFSKYMCYASKHKHTYEVCTGEALAGSKETWTRSPGCSEGLCELEASLSLTICIYISGVGPAGFQRSFQLGQSVDPHIFQPVLST